MDDSMAATGNRIESFGCVIGVFRKLRLDESQHGNVNVVYPIEFAP
jgi:hypothetical protein